MYSDNSKSFFFPNDFEISGLDCIYLLKRVIKTLHPKIFQNVSRKKTKTKKNNFHNQVVLDLVLTMKILLIETFVVMKCEKC